MKKMYAKLIAITLALMLSVTAVVMSSYSWMVLASSPAAEGIQVTIGGGNTILVAADLSKEENGTVYHYPGTFSSTLNFGQHESYAYLSELEGLVPVSTADGLNWFLPNYYDLTDREVQEGQVLSGMLKSIQDFIRDDDLKYANLSAEKGELVSQGSYIYLDFWVVAPAADYTLRVSTGDDSSGSFAIGLMDVTSTESGYKLVSDSCDASASIRLGFLVNPDELVDGSYAAYQTSAAYARQYTALRGTYMEPMGGQVYCSDYHFTIYEPNGDYHPGDESVDGSYVITCPLALLGDGSVGYADISSCLTVQKKSTWAIAEDSVTSMIEQRFQTYLQGENTAGLSLSEIRQGFFESYLGGQVAPYVEKGEFIKSTNNLYVGAGIGGKEAVVSEDYLTDGFIAGATDDVYIIELEENIPQRVRLFIWLEGEDVDCVRSTSMSSFALNIELAGSNAND